MSDSTSLSTLSAMRLKFADIATDADCDPPNALRVSVVLFSVAGAQVISSL